MSHLRALFVALTALLCLGLAGCLAAPALPDTTPSPTTMGSGFAIYLLAPGVSPQQLATLSHLPLEQAPFLSGGEIVAYTQATHEVELTAAGYERLHSLSVPVSGKAFAVCVDGQPIYAGAFWVGYSSLSFDGVVIDPILVSKEHPVMRIQLGYPGASFFTGHDPRADEQIMQALRRAGKLR